MHISPSLHLIGATLLLSSMCLAQGPPTAAPQSDRELLQIITAQDAALFNAVNHCDLATVEAMFAEDVEFYHDKADPQYGRATVLGNIKKNLCGQVERELVPGSIEVYPIHNYGAVEIGIHRFHHVGVRNDVVGEAKFIHLWRLKDGKWRITRVISYDHGEVK